MVETLGKQLRAAREKASITIDDAVYLAKMPRAVVQALEADDYGFFTSPLYARSFLKQYSEYVGVDVEPWLEDLVPTTLLDGDDVESFIDLSRSMSAPVVKETAKPKHSGGAMAAVWMILITGGVVWGGIKMYEYFDGKFSEKETPVVKKQPAAVGDTDPALKKETAGQTEAEEKQKPVVSTVQSPPPRAIPVQENE